MLINCIVLRDLDYMTHDNGLDYLFHRHQSCSTKQPSMDQCHSLLGLNCWYFTRSLTSFAVVLEEAGGKNVPLVCELSEQIFSLAMFIDLQDPGTQHQL